MWKKNLWLKVIALLIAIFLWFQAILLKEYTTVVSLPVVILNLPSEKTLNNLPSKVDVQVKGVGLEILKLYLFKGQAVIDARDVTNNETKISPTDYQLEIPPQVHLEIIKLAENSTSAQSQYLKKYQLPIQVEFQNKEAETMFNEKNFFVVPDKVEILATEEEASKLSSIKTRPIKLKDLNQSYFKQPLRQYDNVTLSLSYVELKQATSKLETTVFSNIPIRNDSNLKIFPQVASVRIRCSADKLKTLKQDQIIVYFNLTEKQDNQVPLKVSLPEEIELINITPEQIIFLEAYD